jgi:IclR family acetate operon transcriptional repressor
MNARYRVPAVSATVRILSQLAAADGAGASQAELARETGISKSTIHNLLGTLEEAGYVRRSAATRRYQLGGALIPLGTAAARQVRTITLAIDRLAELASRHGVSAAVAQVTPDGDAQVVDRAYPPESVHVGVRIGSRYGYLDGAIGKCLLAALDAAEARRIVCAGPIPAHTHRTVTKAAELLAEVELVRARGWGASIGEYNDNIAVAASILGGDRSAEAILLALGFPSDIPERSVPVIGQALAREAATITAHAGGATPNGDVGVTDRASASANASRIEKNPDQMETQ